MRMAFIVGSAVVVGAFLLLSCSSTPVDTSASIHVPSWSPPTIGVVSGELDELEFGDFIDASYRLYLMRYPQILTHYGLARAFGVRNDRLDDYSAEYLQETQAIESLILDRLRSFDRLSLSEDQQITYDVCEWYWDDLVRAQEFSDYEYLVSHYYITSRDWAVYDLLVEVHPFTYVSDVEDYIARLDAIDVQFDQLIAALDARAEKGLLPPERILRRAVANLQGMAYAQPAYHPFLNALRVGMDAVSSLSSKQRDSFEAQALSLLEDQVCPAYMRLYDKLRELEDLAPEAVGYSALPGGSDYYAYALRHQNQTDMTAEEIHQLGLDQVALIEQEIHEAATALGYPEDLSIASIYSRVAQDGGIIPANQAVATYQDLIDEARVNAADVFETVPTQRVDVIGAAQGGYYRPSSGYQPAQFVATISGAQPYYSMPTLAYHETIPGHHLQIALASSLDLPRLRTTEAFLGFTEGWALYGEQLAWELGWYDEDPYGNLGRLSDAMMRAVRLVVDTGLHAKDWTYDEAVNYFVSETGRSYSFARGQIERYLVWPGQSTAYMIGQQKLLELRRLTQETLGDAFDLKAFHSLILKNGSLPLEILERIVRTDLGLD